MKLYLISQDKNNYYDTYDSAVVAAESEDQAKNIHPGHACWLGQSAWTTPEHVTVKYIGEAAPNTLTGVICASFNAG